MLAAIQVRILLVDGDHRVAVYACEPIAPSEGEESRTDLRLLTRRLAGVKGTVHVLHSKMLDRHTTCPLYASAELLYDYGPAWHTRGQWTSKR
jgi:hypothetical protein